ncbi:MAG: hypothetical protein OEP95_10095 [Myxococcales bacterium]|nr:hypothetical protein [Myxococcales bacterium]
MWVRTTEHTPAASADTQRGFQVTRSGGGEILELWGPLEPGWADPLCRGLSRAGVSIRRGFALCTRESVPVWHTRFELQRDEDSTDPLLLDYLELVARGRTPGRAPIQLSDYEISESDRHGGTLLIRLQGPDRIGFLGGVLERLSFLELTPVEMRIETGEDGVDDTFFVHSRSGDLPSEATRKLLGEILDGRLLR